MWFKLYGALHKEGSWTLTVPRMSLLNCSQLKTLPFLEKQFFDISTISLRGRMVSHRFKFAILPTKAWLSWKPPPRESCSWPNTTTPPFSIIWPALSPVPFSSSFPSIKILFWPSVFRQVAHTWCHSPSRTDMTALLKR